MRGPFHYVNRKYFKGNVLDDVLRSEDRLSIKASRAIGGLVVAMFATLTTLAAVETADRVESALHSSDTVVTGAEAFSASGSATVGIVTGLFTAEMAAFVVSSTRRIRELGDA